jgi:hypothetical protein
MSDSSPAPIDERSAVMMNSAGRFGPETTVTLSREGIFT